MNRWYGQGAFLVSFVLMILIRAPHGNRSRKIRVVQTHRNHRERALVAIMWVVTLVLPAVALATPLLSFADYSLQAWTLWAGVICATGGLWLFHRSHVDLGTNWSVSLDIRGGHTLVTDGVYKRIRHPMYASMILLAIAQALLLPNWFAGPAWIVAVVVTLPFRILSEERMMTAAFGRDYVEYMARTKRLVPGTV